MKILETYKGFTKIDYHRFVDAIRENNVNLVKQIIDSGIDVNYEIGYMSPITLAARYGYDEILHLLIDAGADINVVDTNGETPLMYAFSFGQVNTFKSLVKTGADLTIKNNKGKNCFELVYIIPEINKWLETEEAQSLILDKSPILILSLIKKGITILDKYLEKYDYILRGDELNLL